MARHRILSDELLQVIGSIVVHHAELEHWLDGMVYAIHANIPASRKDYAFPPHHMKTEMEFLETCFSNLPELDAFKEEGLDYLARIKAVGPTRHDVVHSWLRLWEKDKGELKFGRTIKPPGKNTGLEIHLITIPVAELVRDAERIKALCQPVGQFMMRVLDKLGPKKKQD